MFYYKKLIKLIMMYLKYLNLGFLYIDVLLKLVVYKVNILLIN
jgi:hypothetical protein